jgi:hypothetical protein
MGQPIGGACEIVEDLVDPHRSRLQLTCRAIAGPY